MFSKVLLSTIIACTIAAPIAPTAEEVKSQLLSAGVSESTTNQLLEITKSHGVALDIAQKSGNVIDIIVEIAKLSGDIDAYLATRSESDQAGYKLYTERVKAEETKNQLLAAGVSESTVIQLGKVQGDKDAYMATQSESDQAGYKLYKERTFQKQ